MPLNVSKHSLLFTTCTSLFISVVILWLLAY